ncbi:MAG TPA: OsmC family peroxiredoxin [Bacteroidales bacterium]|nr:OsmC family peroxiredoxin [Bacteroidales bacterium]
MKRTAKAHWSGSLKEGSGTLTSQSNVLNNTNYSFKSRFEEGETGTNPEELLAAAHAGCFTMWVASLLTQKGLPEVSLETHATVTLEGVDITGIKLSITGSVPGISAGDFEEITKEAERDCIISKTLKIPITTIAHLIA